VGDGGLLHAVVVGLGASVHGRGTLVNVVRTGDGENVMTTVGRGGMLCRASSEAAAMQYDRFTGRFEQSAMSGFNLRISASLTCQSLARDAHVSPEYAGTLKPHVTDSAASARAESDARVM
jgi:hypothetical protein